MRTGGAEIQKGERVQLAKRGYDESDMEVDTDIVDGSLGKRNNLWFLLPARVRRRLGKTNPAITNELPMLGLPRDWQPSVS